MMELLWTKAGNQKCWVLQAGSVVQWWWWTWMSSPQSFLFPKHVQKSCRHTQDTTARTSLTKHLTPKLRTVLPMLFWVWVTLVFSLCFSLHFLLLFVLLFLKTYPHTKQGSAQPRHAACPFLSRCKMCNSPLVGLVMNSCIFRSLGFAVCNP